MLLRSLLQTELTSAMRHRDRDSVRILRTALAALDNAEAVPATEATPTIGLGATEAPRRELSEREARQVVRREVEEHRAAARSIHPHDTPRAAALEAQADVLERLLDA